MVPYSSDWDVFPSGQHPNSLHPHPSGGVQSGQFVPKASSLAVYPSVQHPNFVPAHSLSSVSQGGGKAIVILPGLQLDPI